MTTATRPGAGRRRRIQRAAGHSPAHVAAPLIAFICGLLLIASREPHGWASVFNPATFTRWDANWYLLIARHGYSARFLANLGWFVGYPLVMRAVAVTGIPLGYAGLIVAWVFWYLTLLMIWLLSSPAQTSSSRRWGTTTQWLCLLIAAYFPGQVYFAAIFPISMATFGMLGCCYWSARNPDWRLAAVAGLAAGSAYLPTVALIPGLLVAAVATRNRQARTAMCLGAAGVGAGVAGVLVYAQAAAGRWNLYFTGKSKEFGVGAHNPLATIFARFNYFARLLRSADHREIAGRAIAEQGILLALLLGLALLGLALAAIAARTSRSLPAADIVLVIAAVAGWLIPYIAGGRLSIYRDEAMAILLVPLLRHLPKCSLVVSLLAAIWVAAGMATLFFGDVLR